VFCKLQLEIRTKYGFVRLLVYGTNRTSLPTLQPNLQIVSFHTWIKSFFSGDLLTAYRSSNSVKFGRHRGR